jgi:sec-independent protein translocase protein TatA
MGRLGPSEILLIVAVALLLFGGGRIAEIGKGLGEGIRNFKKGLSEPAKVADSTAADDKDKDKDKDKKGRKDAEDKDAEA